MEVIMKSKVERICVINPSVGEKEAVSLALKKINIFARRKAEVINQPKIYYKPYYLTLVDYIIKNPKESIRSSIKYIVDGLSHYSMPVDSNLVLDVREKNISSKQIIETQPNLDELKKIVRDNVMKYFYKKYRAYPLMEIRKMEKVFRCFWVVDIVIAKKIKQISIPGDDYFVVCTHL
jgi:hypothetical protein